VVPGRKIDRLKVGKGRPFAIRAGNSNKTCPWKIQVEVIKYLLGPIEPKLDLFRVE